MKQITKHQLGIPTWHEEKLDWRRSYLEDVKSGRLVGKEFKTIKGKRFIALAILYFRDKNKYFLKYPFKDLQK